MAILALGAAARLPAQYYSATDLGAIIGAGPFGSALGVNNSGLVVGQTYTGPTATSAFTYSAPGGLMKSLGTLGGAGTNSYAYAINKYGAVVGKAQLSSGGPDGYRHRLRQHGHERDVVDDRGGREPDPDADSNPDPDAHGVAHAKAPPEPAADPVGRRRHPGRPPQGGRPA